MSSKTIKLESGGGTSYGLSMGAALAMVISWSVNKSILWAIVHGICSWFYVIYYALGYGR